MQNEFPRLRHVNEPLREWHNNRLEVSILAGTRLPLVQIHWFKPIVPHSAFDDDFVELISERMTVRDAVKRATDLARKHRIPDVFLDLEFGSGPRPQPLVRLPWSRSLTKTIYRYHSPRYYDPASFLMTFVDSQRKWEAKERFAGRGYNPGHFFSLTKIAASAESAYYDRNYARTKLLLEFEVEFDDVLDLTVEKNLRAVMANHAADPDGIEARRFLWHLQFFRDLSPGGNSLLDDIGRWAWECGYQGILFYGARVFGQEDRAELSPNMWDTYFGSSRVEGRLRADDSVQNLVVLDGAQLTRAVIKHRPVEEAWNVNPFYGSSLAEYDQRLIGKNCPYDREFQDECASDMMSRKHVTRVKPKLT